MARVIGLTGGLASGKSTVAEMLAELGAVIVDADQVAANVREPGGEAFQEILQAFGPDILDEEGHIDRPRLAARIFADAEARRRLNAITHPRIRERMAREVTRLQRSLPPGGVIILDIPLLLDTATRDAYALQGVIVVFVDEATQVARLREREGLSEMDALERLKAQRPLREKAAEADWVIDNAGSPEVTRRQVREVWKTISG